MGSGPDPRQAVSDDQMGGAPAGSSFGLGSVGLCLPEPRRLGGGARAPRGRFRPVRYRRRREMAPAAGCRLSATSRRSSGSAGIAPANLPAPRGAGLITDLAAFRHGPIDECLTRLFGGLRRTSRQSSRLTVIPIFLPVALAVVALEAARRWRRRSTRRPRQSRRFRNFVINGLL